MNSHLNNPSQNQQAVERDKVPSILIALAISIFALLIASIVFIVWQLFITQATYSIQDKSQTPRKFVIDTSGRTRDLADFLQKDLLLNKQGGHDPETGLKFQPIAKAISVLLDNPQYISALPLTDATTQPATQPTPQPTPATQPTPQPAPATQPTTTPQPAPATQPTPQPTPPATQQPAPATQPTTQQPTSATQQPTSATHAYISDR